jgi:hypothetical protein
VRLCLRLAAVFGRRGNRALERELVRSLAESHPDVVSDLPEHEKKTLGALAASIERWTPPDPTAPPGRFDASCKSLVNWPGEHEILGLVVPPEGTPATAPRELFVLHAPASRKQVGFFTLSADRPGEKVAETQISAAGLPLVHDLGLWSSRVVFSPGRIVVSGGDAVVGLDTQGLARVWEWHAPGGFPESITITGASGVVVAVVALGEGRYYLQGLDAHTGTELWREGMQEAGLRPMPLCSSNRLVFLPNSGRKQFLVRDLFTGRRAHAFEIKVPVQSLADEEAWIEDDRLILPWFNESRSSERNQMIAVDLASGRLLWRIGFAEIGSEPFVLENVIQHAGKTYLIAGPWPSDEPQARALLELSTGIGAVAPLAHIRIGRDDRILGVGKSERRLRLSSPLVFLLSKSTKSDEARLRAIDLASGELWAQGLGVTIEDVRKVTVPVPALSETTIAIAYTLFSRGNPPRPATDPTSLVFLDRASGLKAERRDLNERHGNSDALRFFPLGDALVIQGDKRLEVLR